MSAVSRVPWPRLSLGPEVEAFLDTESGLLAVALELPQCVPWGLLFFFFFFFLAKVLLISARVIRGEEQSWTVTVL